MSAAYKDRTTEELKQEYAAVKTEFEALKAKNLKLNMARGKPGREQLDLVSDILTVLAKPEDCVVDGVDARNYGELTGLKCAKEFWADMLGCKPEECFVGGNASLTLMFDTITKGYTHGMLHSEKPWCKLDTVKWLCPAPGYDRHFKITEAYGFEMITIPMTATGPDMDMIEDLVKDPAVKGIWCVPKYSNPTGITYSDEVVRRLASMECAAPDFRIFWDNAYAVHHFSDDPTEQDTVLDIAGACREAGNPDRYLKFGSTSKITFPGAGVAAVAASPANVAEIKGRMRAQAIGHDKLNQLRHARFLEEGARLPEHMAAHGALMKPKFDLVAEKLESKLSEAGIATWTNPRGGYFVSFEGPVGTARRTVELAREAGVTMTGAGATWPYGNDPADSNIRIAPSLPPLEELDAAMDVFTCCVKLAALEQLVEG